MAASLTAVFSLVDNISAALDSIATSGSAVFGNLERTASTADSAFGTVEQGATRARAATEIASNAVRDYFDRNNELSRAIDTASDAQSELTSAIEAAAQASEEIAENEKVSVETREELAQVSAEAEAAISALTEAQEEASAALEEYNNLVVSGSTDMNALLAASTRAGRASDELANAHERASRAADELSEATSRAADEAENGSQQGQNAIDALSNALASAGILKGIQEITQALLDAAAASAQVETAYAKLQTIAGSSPMGTLTSEIKELSGDTGIAVDSLADVSYNAISAGSAVENAAGTAEAASKLATAGFTETSSALSVLSTAMNSYGDSAGTATDISNGLIMVQNLGVTTVAELASNMGKSISTASAYNVSLSNLESAYVSVTKAGINTAEGTTYISGMLSELGKEGSGVATILEEQTGKSFGQLMQSGYSLADVLSILYDYAGNNAEAMMNLWSSQTAGMASAAIVNQGLETFNQNLQAIENSAGATESAYAIMANTTEFAQQRMANSAQNLKIAIGDNLTPALNKLYNVGATAFNWAAGFVNDHPNIVKAATAVGIGIGAVAVGVSAASLATTVAIPAIVSFGTALNTALGPIGWVSIGITALTVAVGAFAALLAGEETEYDTWTASTKAQHDALQELNSEYETAVDTYGATSEEALRLRYQMDDLNASFEANKMTVEEFSAKCEELAESHANLAQSYSDANAEIDKEETGTLALIQKLDDLASASEQTEASQMQMQSILDSLNETFPDLAISIDDVTQNTDAMTAALKKAAQEQANQARYQESYDTYVDLLKEQATLEEQIAAAEENIRLEQERMEGMSGWERFWTGTDDLDAYQEALEGLQSAYADNLSMQEQCEQVMQEYADAATEAANGMVSYEEAVNTAMTTVQADIDALCVAYDEVFESARSSIDGQIGLFSNMTTEAELSISEMQSAFDSQIEYLNTYSENLRKAAEYGLDDGLIASLSDGSEESAGHLNAIIENIEKLGATSGEAQQFVEEFNASFQEVEAAKDEFASTIATMETDFDEKMAEIEGRLDDAIGNMNMEADAAAAARETMSAYTQAIRDGTSGAVLAAQAAADSVAAALSTQAPKGVTTTIAGHAGGTTNAEDIFIAGEEGPELVVGASGSTVFPTGETDRIIDALSSVDGGAANTAHEIPVTDNAFSDYSTANTAQSLDSHSDITTNSNRMLSTVFLPEVREDKSTEGAENGHSGDRKFLIGLEGKGNIQVTGGRADEESLLSFLYEHMKPVLSQILRQEIFEEGDLSYEY